MAEPVAPDEKVCPFCAETIKAAAVRCRYCQSDLTEVTGGAVAEPVGVSEPDEPEEPVEDAETDGSAGASDPVPPPGSATGSPVARRTSLLASSRLLVALVVLCLLLAGLTAYAWYRGEHPDAGKAPSGVITSSQARDAGMQAASSLTTKVLSYDWKTLAADTRAAEKVLAPSFRAEYSRAMSGVRTQTVKNQVKLSASVVATSIVSATERKVEALVFVNQVTTAKGTNNRRLDQNRVLVTLTRSGGEWRVSKMKPF